MDINQITRMADNLTDHFEDMSYDFAYELAEETLARGKGLQDAIESYHGTLIDSAHDMFQDR